MKNIITYLLVMMFYFAVLVIVGRLPIVKQSQKNLEMYTGRIVKITQVLDEDNFKNK